MATENMDEELAYVIDLSCREVQRAYKTLGKSAAVVSIYGEEPDVSIFETKSSIPDGSKVMAFAAIRRLDGSAGDFVCGVIAVPGEETSMEVVCLLLVEVRMLIKCDKLLRLILSRGDEGVLSVTYTQQAAELRKQEHANRIGRRFRLLQVRVQRMLAGSEVRKSEI